MEIIFVFSEIKLIHKRNDLMSNCTHFDACSITSLIVDIIFCALHSLPLATLSRFVDEGITIPTIA